ncbi:MAG TPA: hypothetical protein VJT72_20590 [Pseudonocardiaceae bacterium]|nr:hypothetical protein [Pseudonocardiaceae bacterium]
MTSKTSPHGGIWSPKLQSRYTPTPAVRGLETGAADLDGDGQVSVHELYRYVYDQVRQNMPDQTPTMSGEGMRGELYLAKNPQALLALPPELERVLTSEIAWERLWAVSGL